MLEPPLLSVIALLYVLYDDPDALFGEHSLIHILMNI